MLSIIIPTKNEEQNIKDTICEIEEKTKGIKKEYIVVDDNSTDDTILNATVLSQICPVRVFKVGFSDLAKSVVFGFRQAKGEYILVMDGDGQHNPDMIPVMYRDLRKTFADIVIADTKHPSIPRFFISEIAKEIARRTIPKAKNAINPISGYFMLRRSVIEEAELNPIGYKVLLEILVRGKYGRVIDYSCELRKRAGGSSKFNIQQVINYLQLIGNLRNYNG